ncbi:Putative rmlC-like cupin domain superfamily, rmlC-like jelly roll protein [Septoria linicola]|uniref:RmlC-like cupin domain superfamily, rmlC-like jelly roll protein n=1 Tax=Septoria linicola TaxID=215465 RepID=A0A9Q9AJE7_9PEZI|nr:putative rmlC-like cupin domain superfamily, rmlC-like jelly roll protein [Septoria linicola]USW47016.1 Putative rmlC-like cupin domain superfamily, rmlC-like jelly roll protein [Septoria linicola]
MALNELSQREAEQKVRGWGFQHIFTWTDRANAHYPPHTHSGLTTHLILAGELTITYPDDVNPQKETFGPGARLDVDAKRRHEVFVGSAGCTYVIGE